MASVEMYALKVSASLAVGIASGLWMFSHKTCLSWTGCISRLCSRLMTNRAGCKRPGVLVRPAVPMVRYDNRPELSTLPPAAGAVVGKSLSVYSALDIQQRSNTVGRRTGAVSLTTIL